MGFVTDRGKTTSENISGGMMNQAAYDQWVRTTPVDEQNDLCVAYNMTFLEDRIVATYIKHSVLDVGCGTGIRMFTYWGDLKLRFCGIEKFQNQIDGSNHAEHIIQGDIADPNFDALFPAIREKLQLQEGEKIGAVVLFGGVVNGLLDASMRDRAWANFAKLLALTDYIIIDAMFRNGHAFYNEERGSIEQLQEGIPPQYYCTFREIRDLNEKHGLGIAAGLDERWFELYRRQFYVLTSIENTGEAHASGTL
jgi:SAM-dependent methyltransferase